MLECTTTINCTMNKISNTKHTKNTGSRKKDLAIIICDSNCGFGKSSAIGSGNGVAVLVAVLIASGSRSGSGSTSRSGSRSDPHLKKFW